MVDEYQEYTPAQNADSASNQAHYRPFGQVSGRSEIKDSDEVVKSNVAYMDD